MAHFGRTAGSIFTATPIGTVARIPDGARTATLALIKVRKPGGLRFGRGAAGRFFTNEEDVLGSFQQQKAIITSWSFNENVNMQFTHTMGNDIYLNVFGNRIGTFTVNGIAFHARSTRNIGRDGERILGCGSEHHGIIEIIKWYRRNRISNPTANRIKMTIGGKETIEGFLISASYRANDPVNWAVEYTMQIATVPK